MATPQNPAKRNKQKRRRTKQLAAWREKNTKTTAPAAAKAPAKKVAAAKAPAAKAPAAKAPAAAAPAAKPKPAK
jgi:hypothetical protein